MIGIGLGLGLGATVVGGSFILPPSRVSAYATGNTTQAAFLAATGLTFTRPAGNTVTVQTSASTRVDGVSGSADIPLIGDAGYGRGLVVEGASTNYAATLGDTRDLTAAGWSVQVGCTRSYISSSNSLGVNAAGNYDYSHVVTTGTGDLVMLGPSGGGGMLGAGHTLFASYWASSRLVASVAQATFLGSFFGNGGGLNGIATGLPSAVYPWGAQGGEYDDAAAVDYFMPVNWDVAVGTIDCLVDACQLDSMGFRLEYKPGSGAGATRTTDTVVSAGGAVLSAASGQFSPYLKFVPKWDTSTRNVPPAANCTAFYLCSFADGFIRINKSTFKVEIQVNSGSTQTSANAVSWARGDVVEIFAAVGNSLASVLQYRVNGGSWTDLVMATSFSAVSTSGDLYWAGDGTNTGSLWCWLQDTATFKPGDAPAGVVTAPFDPATLSASVWLRGDTLTLDGSNNVSSWTDKTGNGNHAAQATSGNRPTGTTATIGGKPAVGFTRINTNSLVIPYAANLQGATVTVFLVWKWNTADHGSSPPFQTLLAHQSSSAWSDGYALANGPAGTDGQVEFWVDAYATDYAGATYADTTARCSIGVYDKTNVRLLVDGASVGSPVAHTTDIAYSNNCQTVLGAYTSAGGTGAVSGYASVDIAEVMIWNRALNSTELANLHTYAQGRYGTP